MVGDEEKTRGEDDNTHFVFKPKDMLRPNVAPGGHMGTGARGGNTASTTPPEQGKSFDERFEKTPPAQESEQEPLIGIRDPDDPEFNKELEDQGFTLIDPAPDQSQPQGTPEQETTSEPSQDYSDPVDIPENRRTFSERFNEAASPPDNTQDGPDLDLPRHDDSPDRDR